jgi:hypothetical protein
MKARYGCCFFSPPEESPWTFEVGDNIVTIYGRYKTRYGAVKTVNNIEHGEVSQVKDGWTVVFEHVLVQKIQADSEVQALHRAKRTLITLLDRERKALRIEV